MIKNLIDKLKATANFIIPFYNLRPTVYISDYERDKNELVDDLARKRVLIHQLNKRFEISIFVGATIFIFLLFYVVFQNANKPQERVFNTYISEFGIRLNQYSEKSNDEVIGDAEIIIALSMINEEKYNDAALYLSGITGESSDWLKALCFIRLEKDVAAKTTLRKILKSKGKYSLNAKQLLENYYK